MKIPSVTGMANLVPGAPSLSRYGKLIAGLTTLHLKKHDVKNPQNKPRNWSNEQRLKLENGIKIGIWNIRKLNKPGALQHIY